MMPIVVTDIQAEREDLRLAVCEKGGLMRWYSLSQTHGFGNGWIKTNRPCRNWTPTPLFRGRNIGNPLKGDVLDRDCAPRADLLVWLDLPGERVMRQVIARTVRRRLRCQKLWNGNIEPPLWTIFADPEHIVRWAWTTHAKSAERVVAVAEQRPDLMIVRLRSWREVRHWLDGAVHDASAAEP